MHIGPRRSGEGTEDEEQGIIAADSTTTGYALAASTCISSRVIACMQQPGSQLYVFLVTLHCYSKALA